MRVRLVLWRGFSTRYVAERMGRAFAVLGCAVTTEGPADLNFVYYRWVRRDGPVGRPRAIWLVDEPYRLPASLAWSRWFDFVFVNDRSTLRHHHPLRTYWLPPAYEPVELANPIPCEVAFVGAGFPNRRRLVKPLVETLGTERVVLVGPGWPARWQPRAEWVPPAEAARYYAGARVNLNIHRAAPPGLPTPTTPNFRALEIASLGGFQILDHREDLKLFLPSAVTFDGTPEDLLDKVLYYLEHEEERRAIAEACRREVAPHTFLARARLVLEATGLLP